MRTSTETCLVCGKDIGVDKSTISVRGWETFKYNAEERSKIRIPIWHEYYAFTQVDQKVRDARQPVGNRHYKAGCRLAFGKKVLRETFLKDYETTDEVSPVEPESLFCSSQDTPIKQQAPKSSTRSSTGNTTSFSFICFFCNEFRDIDSTGNTEREG